MKKKINKSIQHIQEIVYLKPMSNWEKIKNAFTNFKEAPRGFINKHTILIGASKKWEPERLLIEHNEFRKLGANHLLLNTKYGDRIDAIYLDSKEFIKKMQEYGGEKFIFSIKLDIEKHKTITLDFPGFYFDYKSPGFIKLPIFLKQKLVDSHSGGYFVRYMDQPILIKAIKLGLEIKKNKTEPVSSSQCGTVILSQNKTDIYEQHFNEILTFVFEGMNVIAYNNGGKGLSKGGTSDKHIYESIETVYKYVTEIKHVPDKKILAKGQCFGGTPTAWLASQHPDINVMLDQTPANFHETALHCIANSAIINEVTSSKIIKMIIYSPITKRIINFHFSHYESDKMLKKNRANQLIHINTPDENNMGGDSIIPLEHPIKLLKASCNPTLTKNIGGSHVTDWFLDSRWAKEIFNFMKQNKLSKNLYKKRNENRKRNPYFFITIQNKQEITNCTIQSIRFSMLQQPYLHTPRPLSYLIYGNQFTPFL